MFPAPVGTLPPPGPSNRVTASGLARQGAEVLRMAFGTVARLKPSGKAARGVDENNAGLRRDRLDAPSQSDKSIGYETM